MGFERPQKSDLDRILSVLMHDSRHRLQVKVSNIKSDAIKAGALHGNRLIVTSITAADKIHEEAIHQAQGILLDFIERRESPPAEIVEWARPHLENMNNSLLGVVPPNNIPNDYRRLTRQYSGVFQQRLKQMLRDVEIGFVKGAGFARAEKMESKEEWIRAVEALRLLKPAYGTYEAQITICTRANAGLIRARAASFSMDNKTENDFDIPKQFWWAKGLSALKQNWTSGDFSTYLDEKHHLQAFDVSFLRADIEKLIPSSVVADNPDPATSKGGRPKADWWEDCIIDVAFQYFRAELQPKTQADVERAMQDWIAKQGHEEAATSTVRTRARKLWQAIKRDKDEN
jgi:hypothetical protein